MLPSSRIAHPLRVASGTLGSVADAEDVVQEAWLRLARLEDPSEIEGLRAWLTRVVGRLALDALRRARTRRKTYFGEWLPEPLVGGATLAGPAAPDDPADRVTLDESVTMALLVVPAKSAAQRPSASAAQHPSAGGAGGAGGRAECSPT